MSEVSAVLAELGISSPWLNVPGFLGYLPPAKLELGVPLGAFLPPPLSVIARSPASSRTSIPFAGGMLIRSGLPNPGLAEAMRQYGTRWGRLEAPLWLGLLPRDATDAQEMSARADELECAVTFEMLLPRGATVQKRADILAAAQGEKPFFVELPLDEVSREAVEVIRKSSARGIVVSAPRGTLLQGDQWVSGRLYGPALHPQMVRVVKDMVQAGLTVIAGCGVSTAAQGEALLQLGVSAIQFDIAWWG